MFLLPVAVDVPMSRWPISNFILIGAIVLAFLYQIVATPELSISHPMVLSGWDLGGLFGYMFLHADIYHLVGNMIFLWVFGNAVCAKVGNLVYIPAFLALGVSAGIAHLLIDDAAVIGASGAINGIVGAFLILYPRNDITCFWLFFYRFGQFSLSSIWMILLWFVFDIWGAASGEGGVAYIAHLGGFATGAGIMLALVGTEIIKPSRYEQTLLDWMRSGG